jgi:hypothetical protein
VRKGTVVKLRQNLKKTKVLVLGNLPRSGRVNSEKLKWSLMRTFIYKTFASGVQAAVECSSIPLVHDDHGRNVQVQATTIRFLQIEKRF